MTLIDTHVHTRSYTYESFMNPEEAVLKAKELGLNGLIFTEKNGLWEKQELSKLHAKYGVSLIAGQEVSADYQDSHSHFVVVGINERLYDGMRAEDLINKVHDSGGIIIAAHPMLNHIGIGRKGVLELDVDAIETRREDSLAKEARDSGKAIVAGSDALYSRELGGYATEIDSYCNPENFVQAIREKKTKPLKLENGVYVNLK